MRQFLRSLLTSLDRDGSAIQRIYAMRSEFARLSDDQLRALSAGTSGLLEFMAAAAVAASRILGQDMYDVQLRGALALTRGSIAEMQTGEGKTLAAVPAVAWLARERKGVHVMTVNDYLARRDACWMGDVYRFLGLSTGYVQQGMTPAERRAAYACDITYATANEIGFDVLRDRLALRLDEQVHRPFSAAVIDEVDSILIDEARIPLVIAGGDRGAGALAYVADQVVRRLQPSVHYTVDVGAHNACADGRRHSRGGRRIRLRQSLRGAQSANSTPPCRTRSKPMRFFAATWITWSRAAPSRWWMNSRAGSRSTAAGRPDSIPPWRPRKVSPRSRREWFSAQPRSNTWWRSIHGFAA